MKIKTKICMNKKCKDNYPKYRVNWKWELKECPTCGSKLEKREFTPVTINFNYKKEDVKN